MVLKDALYQAKVVEGQVNPWKIEHSVYSLLLSVSIILRRSARKGLSRLSSKGGRVDPREGYQICCPGVSRHFDQP